MNALDSRWQELSILRLNSTQDHRGADLEVEVTFDARVEKL